MANSKKMKGGKKMDKTITITSIIVAGVVLIALIGFATFNNIANPMQDTVDVQGEATIKVNPDLVAVYFNVETKGDTSQEATQKNAEIVEKLKIALMAEGFNKEDIQTQNFNVYPNYEWNNEKRTEKGFVATHSIRVEMSTEDSEKIGDAVDAGIGAGAGVSYINFELSQEKQNEYKAEAMKLAAQDAKIKAESVAEGFDKSLGKLVSTRVNDFGYYPWMAYEASGARDAAMIKEAVTDIQPSEQDITARVTATFRLR